ncbi:MAG: retropepsin-like domain-containing protein [Saprospiraceae bacterium]|nr:retropepsin-like domain-containing protein [Saprospiraceae bacterium]
MTLHYSILIVWLTFTQGLIYANPKPISFKLAGKLILIQGEIDGKSVNLILDTGIDDVVLNAKYYSGIKTNKTYYGINGMAETVQCKFAGITIGDIYWKSLYTEILSLHHLEEARGLIIHGLIGCSLLKKHELLIDYESSEIQFIELDNKGKQKWDIGLSNPTTVLPFQVKDATPVITVQVNNQMLRLGLDTGAEINLIGQSKEQLITDNLELQGNRVVGGFSKFVKIQRVYVWKNLQVYGTECSPMLTTLVDLSHLNRSLPGIEIDGILGYEFLNQFKVSINFKKRQISIWSEDLSSHDLAYDKIQVILKQ